MDPFRKMLLVGCVTCVFAAAPFASAQQRRSAPPVPRNDVPIPRNDPPPAGSTDRLPPPSRRPPAERRPSQPPKEEDDRSAAERTRDLRDDAIRRHGLGDPDSSGGDSGGDRGRDRDRDRGHDRPRGGYGYPPYYYGNTGFYGNGGYYNNGGYYGGYDHGYDSGYERGVRDGLSQQQPIEPRTSRGAIDDADAAADDGRMDRKPPPGMPRVPPDEILGDTDVSPALRKALDASPEYKKATAELIKAWTQYAEAAEKVLEGLALSQKYKLALSEARKAEAALAQLSNGRGNPADDKLLAATGEARKAREKVRAMERLAIDTDKSCQRLRKNLDLVIEKRTKIRGTIAAKLPPEARKQPVPAGAFPGAAPEAETPGLEQ